MGFNCQSLLKCTYGAEGMAELQIEGIDWHLITNRKHSHSGEITSWVSDIRTRRHAWQTQSGA